MNYEEVKRKIDNKEITQYKNVWTRDMGTKKELYRNLEMLKKRMDEMGYKLTEFKKIIAHGWYTYVALGYKEE